MSKFTAVFQPACSVNTYSMSLIAQSVAEALEQAAAISDRVGYALVSVS